MLHIPSSMFPGGNWGLKRVIDENNEKIIRNTNKPTTEYTLNSFSSKFNIFSNPSINEIAEAETVDIKKILIIFRLMSTGNVE